MSAAPEIDHAGSADVNVRAAAFNRLGACAVVLDGHGTILDSNESWRLFAHLNDGSMADTGVGVNYLEVCDRSAATGTSEAAAVALGLRQILGGQRERFDLEYPCPSPTEDRWFLLQAAAAPAAEGTGVVLFHVDITARKLLADRLAVLADDDQLTGLPNRRSAVRYLGEQLSVAQSDGEPVWVLFLDLDGFKDVNDRHGHHVGDELLVKVAARARRVLRQQDRLCRLGGDEFVLICPGLGRKTAMLLANRLRTVMAAPFQIGDLEVAGGVSVGVAPSRPDSTVESVLADADAGMYIDKQGAARRRALGHRLPRPSVSIPWPARPMESAPSPGAPATSDSEALVAALSGLQARATAAFAHSTDLVLFFAADGTILSTSPASRAMFGVDPDELVGQNGLSLIHPDDQERVFLEFTSIPSLGDCFRTELRVIDGNGHVRWLEQTVTNLIDDPNVGCFVGNLRDVTERVEMLHRIESDRQRLSDAQASAKLGSFEFDLTTGLVRRSDELWRMLGLEPGDGSTDNLDHVHPDDRARVREVVAEAMAGSGPAECVYRIVRADGAVRWVWSQASRLGSPTGNVVVGTMLDITDRHEAELALAHHATHDWVTQLPNAASLHDSLQTALNAASPAANVAVALVDIDHFKLVNDRIGHAVGDEILQAVATELRDGLPSADVVARFGGDEFAIVRTGVQNLAEANELGDLALSLLGEPIVVGDRTVEITVSVGVALSAAADSPASLLGDADDAMYHAKSSGRNRVTVFDSDARTRAHRRRNLAADLPRALEGGQLRVEYQPIIDVATLQTAGFEALLRWAHPELGEITPAEFIPIAEASGLIIPIGEWVFDTAAQQLALWRADPRLPAELWMTINASASQLAEPGMADRLAAKVRRAGVPVSAIHLEITESVMMDRIDNSLRTITELRGAGLKVSIDDFGTGYSSFSYLSRLPVDTIKIDQSFVSDLGEPGRGTSIVRTMVALADTLDLDVVAEGVELPVQLERLQELGCGYAQGFIWSRSMRPDAALAWMIEHAAEPPPLRAVT